MNNQSSFFVVRFSKNSRKHPDQPDKTQKGKRTHQKAYQTTKRCRPSARLIWKSKLQKSFSLPSTSPPPTKNRPMGLAWFALLNYCPLKHNIFLYCDLNKELPHTSSSTWTKSTNSIWTQLSSIFMEKALSTEIPLRMPYVLCGTWYPFGDQAQITKKNIFSLVSFEPWQVALFRRFRVKDRVLLFGKFTQQPQSSNRTVQIFKSTLNESLETRRTSNFSELIGSERTNKFIVCAKVYRISTDVKCSSILS